MGSAEGFALAQGMRDTRGALERWRANPSAVLTPWFAAALGVACSSSSPSGSSPSCSPPILPGLVFVGIHDRVDAGDALPILGRNLLVLALHATACVASFIAGSSMRRVAETKTGISRWVGMNGLGPWPSHG